MSCIGGVAQDSEAQVCQPPVLMLRCSRAEATMASREQLRIRLADRHLSRTFILQCPC